jgi:PAS domain-containing protein
VTDGNPEVAEAEWQKRPANTRRGGAVRRRLISNRYPLAMSVGLFAALYFAGMLPGYIALVCAILMAAVSIFAPVRTAEARRAELLGDRTGSRDWKRSEAIIESFPDPVFVLDRRGIVRFANPASRRVFGKKPAAWRFCAHAFPRPGTACNDKQGAVRRRNRTGGVDRAVPD